MKHVVMFSGGIGSWAAAQRVAVRHGTADLTLLFADTLLEDTDLYRFLVEGGASVLGKPVPMDVLAMARALPEFYEDETGRLEGLKLLREAAQVALPGLVWLAEGRDPWTVFFDTRYLGNSHVDPCSKLLKREVKDAWLDAECDPADTTVYVGIDWTERHRFDGSNGKLGLRARGALAGWTYESPLIAPPWLTKPDFFRSLREVGIRRPRLYALGLSHNNCGGGCVKAGQGHWALLWKVLPQAYRWWEAKEQAIRAFLGKDVSILTDRSGDGKKKPLTLVDFRRRLEAGAQPDFFDIGGCGCMLEVDEEAA